MNHLYVCETLGNKNAARQVSLNPLIGQKYI
jgi:hypothetical protein